MISFVQHHSTNSKKIPITKFLRWVSYSCRKLESMVNNWHNGKRNSHRLEQRKKLWAKEQRGGQTNKYKKWQVSSWSFHQSHWKWCKEEKQKIEGSHIQILQGVQNCPPLAWDQGEIEQQELRLAWRELAEDALRYIYSGWPLQTSMPRDQTGSLMDLPVIANASYQVLKWKL